MPINKLYFISSFLSRIVGFYLIYKSLSRKKGAFLMKGTPYCGLNMDIDNLGRGDEIATSWIPEVCFESYLFLDHKHKEILL